MKIAVVRGKYLNQFEMQNYVPLKGKFDLMAFASLFPIHENVGFPVKKLFSPMDLPDFPYKLPILNRLMTDAMYLVGLERKLKGFDLVCARETYFHFTQQALKAKRMGLVKKVLVTSSETIPFNHEGIWGRKRFKERVISEADHFHCLTQKAKVCLIKEGADEDKISVIGYGVDLEKFRPKDVKNKKGKLTLLFVGRLEEQKGIGDLTKAVNLLSKEFVTIKLKIVGDGPKKNELCFKKGILELTGNLPYQEMPKVYQEADIFVLPSKPTKYWEEYYGMALLEAMASGLPIVATDCGAIPEAVGRAALVVPHSKPKKLYLALKRFIKSKRLRQDYAGLALKRAADRFDSEKQALKIAQLWTKLIR